MYDDNLFYILPIQSMAKYGFLEIHGYTEMVVKTYKYFCRTQWQDRFIFCPFFGRFFSIW